MEFGKRVPHSSSLVMGLELCNEKLMYWVSDGGGVRPSSGAARSERERALMESDASEQPVLAAPEDGRTPIGL